ncbi:hypothetical protein TNCV_1709971 [Trichonephila clavipes]|nr:hypothetical protein TNCV_1709971 [Trichonephila clavipes]
MIAASPLSPDEYAMRIATQTESALICKEYSSPFIVSPIPVFPAPQRTPSPMGRCVRLSAVLPIGRLERVPRRPDKLDFTRFSGYKDVQASAKAACRPGIGTGQADEALDTEY